MLVIRNALKLCPKMGRSSILIRLKRIIWAFMFFHFTGLLYGQHEGDTWVIGYISQEQSPGFGITYIQFGSGNPTFTVYPDYKLRFFETQSNICDEYGDPVLVTNGMEVRGRNGVAVVDSIAFDPDPLGYWQYWYDENDEETYGFPEPNGAIILPVPGIENTYSILYHNSEKKPPGFFQPSKYLEARIEILNDTVYNILYTDKPALPRHKWYTGTISAVRHANGRDWWMIVFEENTPRYYTMILTQVGISLHHEGEVDSVVLDGLGQAVFSSQGNYLARIDAITLEEGGQFITLYAFDRCDGTIERLATLQEDGGFYAGVTFSPSERYLYADNNLKLWQWDLWAEDIAASKVLIDTFDGFTTPPENFFYTTFGPMTIAPDGRIYIVPATGSSKYLHVIDRPDQPGKACRFLQHHIELPTWNARTAPNIPNFRLGPLDGSPCDSLGLDNQPKAWWRFEPDETGLWQNIWFTDLSYYDPEVWHWDFGDGHTSDEIHPMHTFSPGLYEVCLTVTNAYGSDTYCQWVEILTTEVKEWSDQLPDLAITPNPFQNELNIDSHSGKVRLVDLALYDMHGRFVFGGAKTPVPAKINFTGLPPGMYYCRIVEKDGSMQSWKLMKQ